MGYGELDCTMMYTKGRLHDGINILVYKINCKCLDPVIYADEKVPLYSLSPAVPVPLKAQAPNLVLLHLHPAREKKHKNNYIIMQSILCVTIHHPNTCRY